MSRLEVSIRSRHGRTVALGLTIRQYEYNQINLLEVSHNENFISLQLFMRNLAHVFRFGKQLISQLDGHGYIKKLESLLGDRGVVY